jgi:hypothetical protein
MRNTETLGSLNRKKGKSMRLGRTTGDHICFASRALMVAALLASTAGAASAQNVVDLTQRIQDTAGTIQKKLDLLKSPDQTMRVATFHETLRSKNPAMIDVAIEAALASEDRSLQALGVRAAFMQVRSIVAKLDGRGNSSSQTQAVIQACGDAVQYMVEGYSYETGTFEVRGQDHVGVGQINGTTVSLTIEYGCSMTGTLQSDRTFAGLVSAPYKKGSLPARATFR